MRAGCLYLLHATNDLHIETAFFSCSRVWFMTLIYSFFPRFAKNGAAEAKDRIAKEVQGFLKDDCVVSSHLKLHRVLDV